MTPSVPERVPTLGSLTGRPLVAAPYPGAWLFLAVSIYFGWVAAGNYFGLTLLPPGVDPADQLAVNYEVYYYAVDEWLAGGNFYDVSPPGEGEFYEYLYPPITIVAFLPTQLVSPRTGYWLFVGLNALAAGILALLAAWTIEDLGRPLGWLDLGLLFGFCFFGSQMVINFYFGNINLLLGVGVAGGIYLLEVGDQSPRRESTAGALFAIVALFKVFPALLGLYLLRIRAWWATASAIATGLGGLLLAELIFAIGPFGWDTGDGPLGFGMTLRWLNEAVFPRSDTELFVGGFEPGTFFYVTIQRPLSHLIWWIVPGSPEWPAPLLVGGSLAIGIGVAVWALRRLQTRVDRLIGALAAAIAAVVVMPSLQYYVALAFFPMLVLLYALEGRRVQALYLVGGILLAYSHSPGYVLAELAVYPEWVQTVLDPIAAVASTMLLGMAVLLLACGLAKRYRWDEAILPAAALEPRPAGPPLREWLAARGLTLPGRWDPTRRWTVGEADPASPADD